MESTRQLKVARLLQKELAHLFQIESKKMVSKGMKFISVTVVRVTPDLEIAKVYLSIFPSQGNQELLQAINKNTKKIRYDLGMRIRNQMKKIPELLFYLDDTLDYMENIDQLTKE